MEAVEKKWICGLIWVAFLSVSLLLVLSLISISDPSRVFTTTIHRGQTSPPSFAYYISGGSGEVDRIYRLLLAVYHPRNRYLLHIETEGSTKERRRLADLVNSVPAVKAFGNVEVVVVKPDAGTYMGATKLLATLHAAAMFLKNDSRWDWFIDLSALDYPLISQDDLSHVFSYVPRGLNFIDHTSDLGWKEEQRIHPFVVDPGIYLARRTQIFQAAKKRKTPDSFKVFTGSPWVVLSRDFLEFCINGWDNFPRTLLMYVNNLILPEEVYFHSLICNTREFKNKTINSDLRYMIWDKPPKMNPLFLNTSNFDQMAHSGAAFARQFQSDDPVLDMIDKRFLKRGHSRVTPGAWCTGWKSWWIDPCSQWGNVNVFSPALHASKFQELVTHLTDNLTTKSNQCKLNK